MLRHVLRLFCLCVLFTGCGDGKPVTHPVSGKVLFKGQPAAGAFVVFHPLDGGKENTPKPFATAGEDGTYHLKLHAESDGAAEGEYGVTIVWLGKAKEAKISLMEGGGGGVDKFGGRYGDPRNPKFKASVKKGQPNNFDFDTQ